jgi:hypothetical protein
MKRAFLFCRRKDEVRMSATQIGEEEGVTPPPADGELTAKQELALSAVIAHRSLKEAAEAAGISETTLWRYMKDEAFSRRLSDARRDAVNHAAIRLQQASSDAVSVLHELMTKTDAPASARTTAARTVLDYSFRVVEMGEMKRRIRELEEFLLRKQEEDALDEATRSEDEE